METPRPRRGQITPSSAVALSEVASELVADLDGDEQDLARRLVLPTRRLGPGTLHLGSLLERERCFAILLWRGLLTHRTSVAGRSMTRVLGEGDIITAGDSYLRSEHADEYVVSDQSAHVALLGPGVLEATRQIPDLLRSLQLRMGAQHHRLVIQMAICQLPRVEDRVLAILWLLAESWGKVSPEGTLLPIDLTHRALGELIGAKRPTVTLAVGQLARQGAAERRSTGWVLHTAPPEGILEPGDRCGARPIRVQSPWALPAAASDDRVAGRRLISLEHLASAIDALRADHERSRARTEDRLLLTRELRRRSQRLRDDIARARASAR